MTSSVRFDSMDFYRFDLPLSIFQVHLFLLLVFSLRNCSAWVKKLMMVHFLYLVVVCCWDSSWFYEICFFLKVSFFWTWSRRCLSLLIDLRILMICYLSIIMTNSSDLQNRVDRVWIKYSEGWHLRWYCEKGWGNCTLLSSINIFFFYRFYKLNSSIY